LSDDQHEYSEKEGTNKFFASEDGKNWPSR
jgi:hypothetical protein